MRSALLLLALHSFILIVCLASPVRLLAQAEPSRDVQVKARYLANIGKFVEWPEGTFASPSAPFVIGIVGYYSFGISLVDELANKTVHGRKVVVRPKKLGGDLRDCQILFISGSERKRFEQILNALRGAHVLTVGESEGFLEAGGALNFVVEGERVRFDANLAAASRENLRISSQLLMMARMVLKDSGTPKISSRGPSRQTFPGSPRLLLDRLRLGKYTAKPSKALVRIISLREGNTGDQEHRRNF